MCVFMVDLQSPIEGSFVFVVRLRVLWRVHQEQLEVFIISSQLTNSNLFQRGRAQPPTSFKQLTLHFIQNHVDLREILLTSSQAVIDLTERTLHPSNSHSIRL